MAGKRIHMVGKKTTKRKKLKRKKGGGGRTRNYEPGHPHPYEHWEKKGKWA